MIAIGKSHPELLSQCGNGLLSEPLNATDDALYDFVYDLYDEITHLFTDDYIHLGGDEGRRNTIELTAYFLHRIPNFHIFHFNTSFARVLGKFH